MALVSQKLTLLWIKKPIEMRKYYMAASKNPQNFRQIEAFSIIGQILTCK